MFKDAFIEIFNNIWPMVFICVVSIVSIRLTFIIKNKIKINILNELFWLLFMMYLMCLFYVVTFQDVSWSSMNFRLFKEIFRYEFGTKLFFKNVVGNMIMFIPFGYFVSTILKTKRPIVIIFLSFITSISIEITQLLIGRVFDVDDVLLNLIGGIIGFYIYYFINVVSNKINKIIKK